MEFILCISLENPSLVDIHGSGRTQRFQTAHQLKFTLLLFSKRSTEKPSMTIFFYSNLNFFFTFHVHVKGRGGRRWVMGIHKFHPTGSLQFSMLSKVILSVGMLVCMGFMSPPIYLCLNLRTVSGCGSGSVVLKKR